jgi:hypothetical protein
MIACLAPLLMLATVCQNEWMTQVAIDAIGTDPTRMAQGIMTGIGFLGAGVIFKERLSSRGFDHRRLDLGHRLHWYTGRHWVLGASHPRHLCHARGVQRFSFDRKQVTERIYAHHHLIIICALDAKPRCRRISCVT